MFGGNGALSISNNFQDLHIERNYFDQLGNFENEFNQNTWLRVQSKTPSSKVGIDIYLNPRWTLGFVTVGFYQSSYNRNTNVSILSVIEGNTTGIVEAINPLDRLFRNSNSNVIVSYKPDSLGSSVSINADYLIYDSQIDQSLINRQMDALYNPMNETT